jgi:hypothetical protein
MPITLKLEQERIIRAEIESGYSRSPDEVLDHALAALTEKRHSRQGATRRKNLAHFLLESPLAGAELNLDGQKDHAGESALASIPSRSAGNSSPSGAAHNFHKTPAESGQVDMSTRRQIAWIAALWVSLFACVLAPQFARGQGAEGTILGHVEDPSGASVPGAEVTVKNLWQTSPIPSKSLLQAITLCLT